MATLFADDILKCIFVNKKTRWSTDPAIHINCDLNLLIFFEITFLKLISYIHCFHYWCSVYDICKWSNTLWPVGRVRFFADYTVSLSSLCRLIWRHWTTKMLVRYMMSSVCLRLRQFSQLSFIQYMGLCVFSLPNSPVMTVRMCTLSYYHHQTGSMNH